MSRSNKWPTCSNFSRAASDHIAVNGSAVAVTGNGTDNQDADRGQGMLANRPRKLVMCSIVWAGIAGILSTAVPMTQAADFQAGAVVVDVTPTQFPVFVNGNMVSRSVSKVLTRVNARGLALSDGTTRMVILVVDSCMMPRPLLDEVKQLASRRTGIPTDHLLISATHAHTAPASMGCLGTDADPRYVPFLKERLASAIVAAVAKLEPAQVGFAKANAAEFTALRRWIRRPDKIDMDPFGNATVRATMHAGSNWDNVTGESGPEDPDLSLISIQSRSGRPIAVLANFSMHYFGDKDISADYFGRFCEGLKQRIAPGSSFVGIISHGCSGDIWRRDYALPPNERKTDQSIDDYTGGLLDIAMRAYAGIRYRQDADVAMAERRMVLNYRVPDQQRLEWARRILAEMGDRPLKTRTEVYAREQIMLHERKQTEVVVQGLRIGDIGIATTPTETYAITGLKIKAASPLPHNMVIELANGGDGYIPPPEQHLFGGYNTWAARSAGLEVMAEPKIVAACLELLEAVSGRPRRETTLSRGAAAEAIARTKPSAWWRLDEFQGPHAIDSSGNDRDAVYESGVTYYLAGPRSEAFCRGGQVNRAAMFVGGRLRSRISQLGDRYSVSMWLWNGMPNDGREVSGWLFSRGRDNGLARHSDHLGIGGTGGHTGRLIFMSGGDDSKLVAGQTEIPRWKWQHVVFVRDRQRVQVYLNGRIEINTTRAADFPSGFDRVFFGGRSDNAFNWEGRLDEIAVFDRALQAADVTILAGN